MMCVEPRSAIRRPQAAGRAGYTLVELLVVLAIMSVLASIAFPITELAARRSREEELRTALRQIRWALDEYKRLVDVGRIAAEPGASGFPPDLRVLVDGAPDAQFADGRRIFILRRLPRDPLAAPGIGEAALTWGLRSYESSADDPRPGRDVFDVYSRAEGTGLDGTPYRSW